MIVLWLIVAHLVGDYLLQTRWQAAGKFGWTWGAAALRADHVAFYSVPFAVVCLFYAHGWNALWFLVVLAVLHFFTDAQRFTSTPGDVVQWKWWRYRGRTDVVADAWIQHLYGSEPPAFDERYLAWRLEKARGVTADTLRWPPPNPWPSMPLAIDQSLHLIQVALLAAIFLT